MKINQLFVTGSLAFFILTGMTQAAEAPKTDARGISAPTVSRDSATSDLYLNEVGVMSQIANKRKPE